MKMGMIFIISLFTALYALLPTVAVCEESDEQISISGYVCVAGKYDTNVDLASKYVPKDAFEPEEIEAAFITEVAALFAFASQWSSPWHLENELYGVTDLYPQTFDDSWFIARDNLYLGIDFGSNTFSFSNEARYFSEPEDVELDNYRNTASLAFKRIFSQLWQGRIWYENIVHLFPESPFFDYYVNGGFLELRNTWMPAFSTYYSYGFQYYLGSYNSSPRDPLSSPEAGYRHSGEIGFESFFAGKNSLIGSYTFEIDDSSGQGVEQIGGFRGEDENLEIDAEFNYAKHKGTLLFSHRFNDRFTLSLYEEYVYKVFFERNKPELFMGRERTDQLLLSSIWFKARLVDGLHAKARYLYRMNESTSRYEDFQDSIFYLGLEYRY